MRRRVAWATAALLAVAGAAAAGAELLEIAPGVTAQLGAAGAGGRSVAEVRVAPPPGSGAEPPDLGPLLEAAYDWCVGNVPNGFRTEWRGMDARHGCDVRVDAGAWRIARTAILRQTRGQQVPVTVDLGAATILHTPAPPRRVRVADLAALRCDAGTLGDYVEVADPESFDDFQRADPEGEVPIARIGPNARETRGCPSGTPRCQYGANAVLVETRGPHGLEDGGALGLGDVVELAVPGTRYDGQRLLVKEVAAPSAFLATLDFATQETATTGSLRETATTIWCNGASWRAGKPMIALAGPGDSRKTPVTLRGGRFAVDGILQRTTAVLVDGDSGPTGRGGAERISVEGVNHAGNASLRGQILVALGTPHQERSLCQQIRVSVDSDAWPGSWSPAVWNQSCASSEIAIRQGHGGGVWWGLDTPAYAGPRGGSLRGVLEGCKDGPCLWVRSGQLVLEGGFRAWGTVLGPFGTPPGPNRGLVALLGSPKGMPVNVVAHGATWGASPDSDLDCYARLAGSARLVQIGGYAVSGDSTRGTGKERLFCREGVEEGGELVLEHLEEASWGGPPRIGR